MSNRDDRQRRAQARRKALQAQRQGQRAARRRGELFQGDAQRNIFGGVEYLDPARVRTDLRESTE